MLESILHFIDLCPDSLTHFDLIDLLLCGMGGGICYTCRIKCSKLLYNIRKKLKLG